MGNEARIFCIRVSSLQSNPLSETVLEQLKAWSQWTETFPNGDILYNSRDMLGGPGIMLLKLLHNANVRFNYFARADLPAEDLKKEYLGHDVKAPAPASLKVASRPTHFLVSVPVGTIKGTDPATLEMIHECCVEEYDQGDGMRRYVIPPFERFAVAMVFDQLVREDVQFEMFYFPEGGGK